MVLYLYITSRYYFMSGYISLIYQFLWQNYYHMVLPDMRKQGLYTQNTSLHVNSLNFTFSVSHTNSVNCIKLPIACCISCKIFINKLHLATKSKEVVNFYVHTSPIFSCLVTISVQITHHLAISYMATMEDYMRPVADEGGWVLR